MYVEGGVMTMIKLLYYKGREDVMIYYQVQYRGKMRMLCLTCVLQEEHGIIQGLVLEDKDCVCACCGQKQSAKQWWLDWKKIVNKIAGKN